MNKLVVLSVFALAAASSALANPAQTITLQPGSVITLSPNQLTTVSCDGSSAQAVTKTACICGSHAGDDVAVDLILTAVTTNGNIINNVVTTFQDDEYYVANKAECQTALEADQLCQ